MRSLSEGKEKDPRIWVLEDDRSLWDAFRSLLGKTYNLSFFETIRELDELLQAGSIYKPNLLIADLDLPDGRFDEYISENWKLCNFPFMVSTGDASQEVLENCFRLRALDVLLKPYNPKILPSKVSWLLEQIKYDEERKSEIMDAVNLLLRRPRPLQN